METKPKANSVITTEAVVVDNVVTGIKFKVKDAGEITLELAKLSDAVRERALIHGMTQRISDAAAISRNPETGKPASAADKLAAMKNLCDYYNGGAAEWNRKRAESAGAGYANGLLAEALKLAYPEKTPERIAEYIKGLKASERVALLASDTLKDFVDQIRSEAAKATKVDADKLLAGL